MGLFDRFSRVVRAHVNSLTTNAEDPEKVLEQTVMEMQDNLIQLRFCVASAIATQKRTERQAANAQATAQEWYRRAQLAIGQDNEPLAREALTKRKSYQDTADTLSSQIEQQNTVVATLKKDMRSLELKIAEIKNKKDIYIARVRSAQASLRLQELMGELSGATSTNVFERVEDKILQIEAQKEVNSITSEDNLEKKFLALESNDNIDNELSAIKSQLHTNNPGEKN
jgi:phage shock protein A